MKSEISYRSTSIQGNCTECLNSKETAMQGHRSHRDLNAFCPLIVTVEGFAHKSMQAFLRRIAAQISAKWQKPLSMVTNWVRVRVQFALIKAVDL